MRLSFGGGAKVLAAILALGLAGAYMAPRWTGELFESAEEYGARERVRRVLQGLMSGTSRQEAVCLWSTGTLIMPDTAFNLAEDAFDAWARAEGILPVTAFEVVQSRMVPMEQHTPGTGTVMVRVRINDREHVIRSAPGERLAWVAP